MEVVPGGSKSRTREGVVYTHACTVQFTLDVASKSKAPWASLFSEILELNPNLSYFHPNPNLRRAGTES